MSLTHEGLRHTMLSQEMWHETLGLWINCILFWFTRALLYNYRLHNDKMIMSQLGCGQVSDYMCCWMIKSEGEDLFPITLLSKNQSLIAFFFNSHSDSVCLLLLASDSDSSMGSWIDDIRQCPHLVMKVSFWMAILTLFKLHILVRHYNNSQK